MNKDLARQILVILAVLATITVNALANILPINGQGTGEISDRFQVYFVPAGYVFSIWGVVYLGWLAYAIYQALPAQRNNPLLRAIALPFIVNGLANSSWIFAWHYVTICRLEIRARGLRGTQQHSLRETGTCNQH